MRYYNARVYEKNDLLSGKVVIEVEDGIIIGIHKQTDFTPEEGDYDCKGMIAYPAFMDCDVSVPGAEAFSLFGVNIQRYNSVDVYLQVLSLSRYADGIRAFGFNTNVLGEEGARRIKRLLDRLCPDKRAYVIADDQTNVIVNNYILEEAKQFFVVGRETVEDGMLDIFEFEMLRKNTDIFDFTRDEIRLSLLAFQNKMLENGITSIRVLDMFGGLNAAHAIRDLIEEGAWVLTAVVYVPIYPFETEDEMFARYQSYVELECDRMLIHGVTVTLDGSIDSGQAALKEPYEMDTSWCGSVLWNRIKLAYTLRSFVTRGVNVNVCAFGDKAAAVAVDTLSYANDKAYTSGSCTLTHAYLISDDDIRECAQKGITVCVEPNNVPYAGSFYEGDRIMLGDRIYEEYPIGRLAFSGVNMLAGSNLPTSEEASPVSGVYKATHRTSEDDITPFRVLAMYGRNAYQYYDLDDKLGAVSVGKQADFVLLDKDIIHMREDLLCDVNYMATVCTGLVMWENIKHINK